MPLETPPTPFRLFALCSRKEGEKARQHGWPNTFQQSSIKATFPFFGKGGRRELSCVSRLSKSSFKARRRSQPPAPLNTSTSGAPWIQPTPEIQPSPEHLTSLSSTLAMTSKGAQSHLPLSQRRSVFGSASACQWILASFPHLPKPAWRS